MHYPPHGVRVDVTPSGAAGAWATRPEGPAFDAAARALERGFGQKTGKSLAFAYLPPELTAVGTELEVMMFTEMRKARIIPESIWDPANERLRA